MTKSTTIVKKKIALLTGGYGAEYDISIKSAAHVEAHLNSDLYDVYVIHINREKWYHRETERLINRNDFSLQLDDEIISFDLALIIIHGDPAENGRLQGYFESIRLPISTCETLVSALTFNKYMCNYMLTDFGVRSARARLIKQHDVYAIDRISDLGFPMFVKPNRNGSSYGITKVNHLEALVPAIKKGFEYDTELIIEEFMPGREFTCGVVCLGGEIITFPVTEIISYNEYFDYAAKYENASDEITPADISNELSERCQTITKRIYKGLGCRGMVRVDFILKDNAFYVIEVNTIPGLTERSLFPQQVEAHGWTMSEFLDKLIVELL